MAKCPVCGNEFKKKRWNQRYCSKQCQGVALQKNVVVKIRYVGIAKTPMHLIVRGSAGRKNLCRGGKQHLLLSSIKDKRSHPTEYTNVLCLNRNIRYLNRGEGEM